MPLALQRLQITLQQHLFQRWLAFAIIKPLAPRPPCGTRAVRARSREEDEAMPRLPRRSYMMFAVTLQCAARV